MKQLIYTSAPRGLVPGTFGFCTVAASVDIDEQLRRRLEGMSAYDPLYPLSDRRYGANPVAFSWLRIGQGLNALGLLSRVSAAPPDHTGRSNVIAHHLISSGTERPSAGPAETLFSASFVTKWQGEPQELGHIDIAVCDRAAMPCEAWRAAFG